MTEGNNVLGRTMSFEKTSYDAIEVEVINDEGDEVFGASEGFQRMKKDRCRYGYHIFKTGEKIFPWNWVKS